MRTKLSQFSFDYTENQVASYPAPNRDDARLMVIDRKTGKIEHKIFKDLIDYFDEGDIMLYNNTKVFPARLYGRKEKTGAKIEVFLLRELNHDTRLWDVLVDPARKIRVGNKLYFSDDDDNDVLIAEVVDNTTSRGRTIRFLFDGTDDEFQEALNFLGNTPLPKYINRPCEAGDREWYQTIFAKDIGAVAAPTAGMHFSKELMKRMEIKGVEFAPITLHLGLGTFRTIDAEFYRVPPETVNLVNVAKNKERTGRNKVCAIGTTSLRAVESAVSAEGQLKTVESGWTNKFIFPPFDFNIADSLISNFHLPKSSLLIMVAAFGGHELVMHAYEEALKEGYRLFSYGDAMFIK